MTTTRRLGASGRTPMSPEGIVQSAAVEIAMESSGELAGRGAAGRRTRARWCRKLSQKSSTAPRPLVAATVADWDATIVIVLVVFAVMDHTFVLAETLRSNPMDFAVSEYGCGRTTPASCCCGEEVSCQSVQPRVDTVIRRNSSHVNAHVKTTAIVSRVLPCSVR